MIGGGIGGLLCGLTQVKACAMSSPGLASIARILKFKEQIPEGSKEKSETTETADFHSTETKEALEPGVIYSPLGESNPAIFEVHQMMLEDEDYLESIENMIRTELLM